MPLSAVLGESQIVVTFSRDLVDQPLSEANWTTDLGAAVSADVSGPDAVTVRIPDGIEPSRISYAATPADVIAAPPPPGGLPAAAFEDFPVT